MLAPGESLQTYAALFPQLAGSSATQFNPYVISSVVLANNTSYTMLYNSYGELVKITLPTGAVIGYKYGEAYAGGSSGVIPLSDGINYNIVRPLVERDEYANGSTLSAKMLYSAIGGTDGSTGRPNLEGTAQFEDQNGNLLRQENHYFYGNPLSTAPPPADNAYADWWEGLEYRTDITNGTTTLQETQRVYQQRPWAAGENAWFTIASGTAGDAEPLHDPQLCQVTTNFGGSAGSAGSVYVYDAYNNITGQYDFDFGTAPAIGTTCPVPPFPSALRNTQTTYLTASNYTAPSTNLVNLPTEVTIYNGAGKLYTDTKYGYDSVAPNNAPNINTGHDNTNYAGAAARGNLTSVSQYLDRTTSWLTTTNTYDIAGNLVAITDANNHTTSLSYGDNYTDGVNRWSYALPTSATNAAGQTATVQYDYSTAKPTLIKDPNGVQTTEAYNDLLDRVTNITKAAGTGVAAETGYSYVSPTNLVIGQDLNTTGDQALVTQKYWDGFGRLTATQQIETAGNWASYIETDTTYDALGRVASTSIPWRNGSYGPGWPQAVTAYTYDALNRQTAIKTPDGAKATTGYSGNQTFFTDQAKHSKLYLTDGVGRLKEVVDDPGGLAYLTTYTYGANDGLHNVTQGSQQRIFYRDTLNRVFATQEPETGFTFYYYDNVGNLSSVTDARGTIKNYYYDAINRLTKIWHSDGTPTSRYSYDTAPYGIGRIAQAGNNFSLTSYTSYDPLGRVLASQQVTSTFPLRGFSYTYNLAGALTSETLPSGRTITTNYDAANRPSTLAGTLNSVPTNYVTSSSYWPTNVPYYFVRGSNNNVWSATSFNSRLQLQESYEAINNQIGQMLFVSCPNWGVQTNNDWGVYAICPAVNQTNDNGNLQGYTEYQGGPGYPAFQTFNQTFTYDNVNRLVAANEGTTGWSRNYGYDKWGNITPGTSNSVIPVVPTSPTAFSSATNQISGPMGTFTYDKAGNQTTANGNTLAFDAENQLKSVTLPASVGGGTETILYDALGQRVQKSPWSGNYTAYVYDAFGQLASEYANGTTWSRDYIRWGGGQLIATENASGPCGTCYFAYDHLSSIRMVMDQNANVVARHDYLPFGEEVSAGVDGRGSQFGLTTDVTQKFTGQIRDQETGLDYFNARYFTASLGRFSSPDPGNAGAILTDPQTWNGYAYVRGNPLAMVDPSGMDAFSGGGDDDPCLDDPFACDPGWEPFPPGGFPQPIPTPPPPSIPEAAGGNPLPPGSFPGGETLGLPPWMSLPGPFAIGLPNPFIFSACSQADPTCVDPQAGGIGPVLLFAYLPNAIVLSKALQHTNPNPTKGVQPVRDNNGRVIGWTIPGKGTEKGKRIRKDLDWGKANGLDPTDPKWVAVGIGAVSVLEFLEWLGLGILAL